jgi:hypothetical protein
MQLTIIFALYLAYGRTKKGVIPGTTYYKSGRISAAVTVAGALMNAPGNLEGLVISQLIDAYESFEVGGADGQGTLASPGGHLVQLWASVVDRQGQILAQLAIEPDTRAELASSMEGLVNRSPAWLDAHLREEKTMTVDLFLRGMAQTMTRQREGISRVAAEQTREPATLEKTLREAPLPESFEDPEHDEFVSALADAVTAHSEVLIGIAAELDALTRGAKRLGG